MKAWIGAGLLATAMPAPAPAQAPAPAPAWQVDWGDQYCILARLADPATPFVTAFRTVPGSGATGIFIVRSGAAPLPQGITAVALAPSARVFAVSARTEHRPGGLTMLELSGLHNDFWDALQRADALRLMAGGEIRRRIALPGAGRAVAALRQCVSLALRDWGVDEAALTALTAWPATTNHFGVSSYDYPSQAIRSSSEGRVVVRVDVSAEGRAAACMPVAPSGSAALDAASCQAILARARFRPARGADGRPTAARIVTTVTWLIAR
jgi:TonB family protein